MKRVVEICQVGVFRKPESICQFLFQIGLFSLEDIINPFVFSFMVHIIYHFPSFATEETVGKERN